MLTYPKRKSLRTGSFVAWTPKGSEDKEVQPCWVSCLGLWGPRHMLAIPADISLSVLAWLLPSLLAAGGSSMSMSTASILDIRIFSSLVFILLFGVSENPLSRFCKLSLLNSTAKPETCDGRASSPLAAFVLFPPWVFPPLRGLEKPFLLLWGQVCTESSIRFVLCSKGRISHPKSLKALTVAWLLFRAVFCRFLISSKLISSSSSRKSLTEAELLHFPRQTVRETKQILKCG